MDRDHMDYEQHLQLPHPFDTEYRSAAESVVTELIARFDNWHDEQKYMSASEFFHYTFGVTLNREFDINAFVALVGRIAAHKGFIIVALPVIDTTKLLENELLITGFRYRAVSNCSLY